jgi:hypothetical protein
MYSLNLLNTLGDDNLMLDIEKSKCELLIHAKELDPKADEQVHLILNHPALHGLIAIMPDAHAGSGCVRLE